MARGGRSRGGVPSTVEELLELPGVGPYAAGAKLAVAFGPTSAGRRRRQRRVYRRYFGLADPGLPRTTRALWELVERAATPDGRSREWNWAVLDLAA